MTDCLLSSKLQQDIIKALNIFRPDAMTAQQFMSCFGDVDDFVMLASVEDLIRQGLIHPDAIRCCLGEQFLWLPRLRLLSNEHEAADDK